MATYSVSAVFNKAAIDIKDAVTQITTNMNIPRNLVPFVLDKVRADFQNDELDELSTLVINLTNENDDLKSKIPPTPKEDKKEET